MHDLVIRNGLIVDGTGGKPFHGNLAVDDGKIVAVGPVEGTGREEIDADGKIVTPGFVDVHSHYDGQVTWDTALAPSSQHGVTTVVMGNCGVGFAPIRPGEAAQRKLIELMEGVEDIPGTALWEGIDWQWESFPDYLDFLESRRFSMDVGGFVAHGAVRTYVMGERGFAHEKATPDDIEAMTRITAEAVRAGAFGFSTSRILGHQSISGSPVPGTFADDAEILGLAAAVASEGGLFELIPGGSSGAGLIDLGIDDLHEVDLRTEIGWMADMSRKTGMKFTYVLLETTGDPDTWRQALAWTDAENRQGAFLYPQVGSRPVGLLLSLEGRHPFELRPTYAKLAGLSVADRLQALRRPEIKRAILSEANVRRPSGFVMDQMTMGLVDNLDRLHPFGADANYTPARGSSVADIAARRNVTPEEAAYDLLLENDGHALLIMPMQNYVHFTEETLHAMLTHSSAILGLADGGAHCSVTCDGSVPTYMLCHWAKNPPPFRLPLEIAVRKQTSETADLLGLRDRGRIAVGKRADLNVIDFDRIRLKAPRMVYDLPAGGGRLLQEAEGYDATIVAGTIVRRNDVDTGARPGRLLRRGAAVA